MRALTPLVTADLPVPIAIRPRKAFLICCGVIAILGSLALIIGNLVGSIFVPNHDWVADTVSDLAAGRYESIQDVALYGYAAALVACAIGAAHLHVGGWRWDAGILALVLLAGTVIVIGARNEYGDRDAEGFVVHRYLVYALGFLFAAAPLLMARGLGKIRPLYRRISFTCAALWIVGAPVFFLVPTSFDGLWERALGLVTIVWVLTLSRFMIEAGIAKQPPSP